MKNTFKKQHWIAYLERRRCAFKLCSKTNHKTDVVIQTKSKFFGWIKTCPEELLVVILFFVSIEGAH